MSGGRENHAILAHCSSSWPFVTNFPDDHEPVPSSPLPPKRVFAVLDVFAAVILVVGMLGFSWLAWTIPPLERVPNPERALALTVSRTLDLEHGMDQLDQWEQWVFAMLSGGSPPLPLAIGWYEELAQSTRDPHVRLYLAILLALRDELP